MLEQNCSHPLGFDDKKVLRKQFGILTYILSVWDHKLKFNSEMTLIKAFVDKLVVSYYDGSEFDDSDNGVSTFEGSDSECGVSASEGLNFDHGIPTSSDNPNSRDFNLRFSSPGLYSVSIADLSCQHQTYGKSQPDSLSVRLKEGWCDLSSSPPRLVYT